MADHRIEQLDRQMKDVIRDVESLLTAVNTTPDQKENSALQDAMWSCGRCGYYIAAYDPDEELLRIRYRDMYLYVKVGAGGFVASPCRKCGHMNRKDYTE